MPKPTRKPMLALYAVLSISHPSLARIFHESLAATTDMAALLSEL
jgi:hypothetical protein